MANDTFGREVERYVKEQKKLLAVERKRFEKDESNLKSKEQCEGKTTKGKPTKKLPVRPSSAKQSKNLVNSEISEKNKRHDVRGPTSSEDQSKPSTAPSGRSKQRSEASLPAPAPSVTVDTSSAAELLPPTQQNEMEQWVSDTFYSYFPSFNKKQNDKKSTLSRTRQQEYQEYLKNIPEVTTKHQQYMQKYGNKGARDGGSNEKGTSTTSPTGNAGKFLTVAPAMNVTASSHPARGGILVHRGPSDAQANVRKDTVDRRNRMLAEEESRRKLEYQRELIKQIDEKRKEVERLKEKEKLEEEMLTSRLEQQLKTMELEEALEREKIRSEKVRIANEQNHIRRLQLLSNLENDHKLFNPYDGQRKAFSENGSKTTEKATTDAKVYRYFSNSAQNEKHAQFASSSLSSEQDYESSSETTVPTAAGQQQSQHRYQYCKNCRADIDRSFLPAHHVHGKGTAGRYCCANCGQRRTGRNCLKCDRTLKRSTKNQLCVGCQQTVEHSNLQREAQAQLLKRQQRAKLLRSMELLNGLDDEEQPPVLEIENPSPPAVSPPNPYKIIDIQYHESDNDHDLAVLNPVIVRKNYKKPYSLNIAKDSLFHPSKKTPEPKVSVNIRNGEVFVDNKFQQRPVSPQLLHAADVDDDDGAGTTTTTTTAADDEMDERISKYVRHYNTLWMKRGNARTNNLNTATMKHSNVSLKTGPLPSLSPPKVYVSDRPDNMKSEALKTIEKKWDIPAVERTKVNESPRVLTQLGAIRKQLQLEQLQMDQTFMKNY